LLEVVEIKLAMEALDPKISKFGGSCGIVREFDSYRLNKKRRKRLK
jgi:hypothetical protein